jgi:hypothetical protein
MSSAQAAVAEAQDDESGLVEEVELLVRQELTVCEH